MSLYNKHRPKSFKRVIGNEKVLDSLTNLLQKEKPPHSFLLTGPTGCGKTTVARIIAKELGCSDEDFREIDSGDFRGIDTVREIRKQSQYKPLSGGIIVWLIDECHKMTNDAQNALLKSLEDVKDHVYYILATTDPQKLLPTIRGRCSTFQMSLLGDDEMLTLLKRVVKKEKQELEQEVYDQIIMDAQGHPRNALTVLEQVLAVPSDKRLEVAKRKAEEYNEVIELCRALISNKSWSKVSPILKGIKDQEPETIRRIVLGYCQSVLLSGKDNDRAGLIMEEFMNPFFNSGFPQVVYACYSVCRN